MPKSLIYVVSGALALGALPLPYGYYVLLRLLATGFFVWAATIAITRKEPVIQWVFLILALMFNPFFKVHFSKGVWSAIDISASLLILVMSSKLEKKKVASFLPKNDQ